MSSVKWETSYQSSKIVSRFTYMTLELIFSRIMREVSEIKCPKIRCPTIRSLVLGVLGLSVPGLSIAGLSIPGLDVLVLRVLGLDVLVLSSSTFYHNDGLSSEAWSFSATLHSGLGV